MGYKSFQEDCNAKEMEKIVHLEISFSPKKKKKNWKNVKNITSFIVQSLQTNVIMNMIGDIQSPHNWILELFLCELWLVTH